MKNIIVIDDNLPYLLNNINFPIGGASVQTKNWIQGFENLGYNIIVISSNNVKNSSRYTIVVNSTKKSKRSVFLIAFNYFKLIHKYRPEFIYISIPWWSNFLISIPAKILNVKVVQRISNDNLINEESKNRFTEKYKYKLYKISLQLADVFICQNDYQMDKLVEKYPRKIIEKLYNPFHRRAHKQIVEKRREYVAWMGLFQYQKNLPELLNITKNLPDINFRIAGNSLSIVDDKTKEALDELRCMPNVEFVGLLSREKIYDFLTYAYCLLNTSHVEGFSNTFLEAFSVGTPVVTRRKTDPDNIVLKNNLGKSVRTYSELSSAIESIVNMPIRSDDLKEYVFNNSGKFF